MKIDLGDLTYTKMEEEKLGMERQKQRDQTAEHARVCPQTAVRSAWRRPDTGCGDAPTSRNRRRADLEESHRDHRHWEVEGNTEPEREREIASDRERERGGGR